MYGEVECQFLAFLVGEGVEAGFFVRGKLVGKGGRDGEWASIGYEAEYDCRDSHCGRRLAWVLSSVACKSGHIE